MQGELTISDHGEMGGGVVSVETGDPFRLLYNKRQDTQCHREKNEISQRRPVSILTRFYWEVRFRVIVECFFSIEETSESCYLR